MIALPQAVRVFLCLEPTDMRRSFDGLSGMAEHLMQQDPRSGHLFVFRNRARDRIKLLYWDGDGLALWYKRLERGCFEFPTDRSPPAEEQTGAEISASDLALLLGGIDLASVKRRPRYRREAARSELFKESATT